MVKKLTLILAVLLLAVSVVAQTGQTEQAAQTETMATPEPVAQTLDVETQMCSGIEDRMPVGPSDTFPIGLETVFLWCKVTGAQDTTSITLVWSHEGEEVARFDLPVKSPSWRTWGSKNLLPEWTGKWEVKILNPQGDILKAVNFTVTDDTSAVPEAVKTPARKPADADTTMPADSGM